MNLHSVAPTLEEEQSLLPNIHTRYIKTDITQAPGYLMPSPGLLNTCVYVNVYVFLSHVIVHKEKHLILNLTS